MSESTIDQSRKRYAIERWAEGYFDIDDQGQLCALPQGAASTPLPLIEIVEQARRQGLRRPLLLRFPQILESRARQLIHAFNKAIDELDYQGQYTAVYPIKV
ncbi:MAG: arginine decarboxylase, partial [Pseudomonadota bacterium]